MENRRILVDTSVLIDFFRKEDKKSTIFYQLHHDHEIFISTISEFEFLAGVKDENFKPITHFFQGIDILSFDSRAAVTASRIYQELKSRNQLIEFRDIFIGATAMVNDIRLATLNHKHFQRISGLKVFTP